MSIKRFVVVVLSLIVVLVGVLAACAAPTPTSTPTSTPTVTPTATPTGPLAQIIAGAKKEGTVSIQIAPSSLTPQSIERLERDIKERFGVDLDIKYTPTISMTRNLAEAIMEYQSGATPTYGVYSGAPNHVSKGVEVGIFEPVDWKPLITEDTNPEAIMEQPLLRGALMYYTSTIGILYNPEKVPADAVPQTTSDLANPRWKGKVAILDVPSHWVRQSFILGKEKTLADLRAIMKNGAIRGQYAAQFNRYLLGEVWFNKTISAYWQKALAKGMPAAFALPDYAEITDFSLIVRKGAPHPNAAKLVAIYLATPAGCKFLVEEGESANILYPGNFEHDVVDEATKQGVPMHTIEGYPGLLEFVVSDEAAQLEKQLQLILEGQ